MVNAISAFTRRFSYVPRRPIKNPIELTPAAVNQVKLLLNKQEDPKVIGIQIGVKARGCNGLSYKLNYFSNDNKPFAGESFQQDGVAVRIEEKGLLHLIGTTMDYQQMLLSSEFTFENPNAKGSCGCGESFNPK
ncbi:Fe-S cluster assembly scaffold SufA [Candidatus Marinamargulisbacteria bacterium SCGC AG-414-C22]|nr:Fe-S cluster assembly scaffold SufA [Candidatus Marinamargulisbacteria bacterium SCGC AG-414-C22]